MERGVLFQKLGNVRGWRKRSEGGKGVGEIVEKVVDEWEVLSYARRGKDPS